MITTKSLWKILNGECTLPEALKKFGSEQEAIDEITTRLKKADKADVSNYAAFCHWIKVITYKELVGRGKVDSTKIFNLATNSFDGEGRSGDMGISGCKNYIFLNESWKIAF